MFRRILLFLVVILSFVGNCSMHNNKKQEKVPPKPGLTWVGGADGGAWIKLENCDTAIYAEIYHENGELWHKGLFAIVGGNYSFETVKINLSGYDGERIHLKFPGIYLREVEQVQ